MGNLKLMTEEHPGCENTENLTQIYVRELLAKENQIVEKVLTHYLERQPDEGDIEKTKKKYLMGQFDSYVLEYDGVVLGRVSREWEGAFCKIIFTPIGAAE